jgi:DsbC/DsbD-like thiol-disulfide interchange protein
LPRLPACAIDLVLASIWLALLPSLGFAGSVSETLRTDNVSARLIAERAQVVPGGRVDLALVLDIRPHWHTYWRNPGDSGEPPRLQWHLPAGVQAGPIRWPAPTLIPVGPLANYGYSGRATHLVELRLPDQWPAGEPLTVRADANWLVCDEACVPEQGSFELTLATGATAAPPTRRSPTSSPLPVRHCRLQASSRPSWSAAIHSCCACLPRHCRLPSPALTSLPMPGGWWNTRRRNAGASKAKSWCWN